MSWKPAVVARYGASVGWAALAAAVGAGAATVSWASDCTKTSVGLVPLNDLGSGVYLGQFQGGLYPGGSNEVPALHHSIGVARAAEIVPRNSAGQASASGKVGLLSIGLSNTTQEFCGGNFPNCQPFSFMGQAAASAGVNHTSLAIVDGAIGGQPAAAWDSPSDTNYDQVRDQRLASAGLTEAQVQAVWIKLANPGPKVSLPNAGADAYALEASLGGVVRACKVRYPNLKVAYLSSRIYAGYASSGLNPEPYAYESGFSVKWLIGAQINQENGGGVDARAGDLDSATVAPFLVWGPYLWADGLSARSDGLTWACADMNPSDGTHPATGARTKAGSAILSTLLASPYAAAWFRNNNPACPFVFAGPGSARVCGGEIVSFAVDAAAQAPMALQWRRDGVPIADETGPALTIASAGPGDAGEYDCVVSNACGSLASAAATLTVCVADYDCDGFVSGDDFDAFVADFVAGEGAADVDRNAFVNGDDFDVFAAGFVAGC